jgi:hypothetical protein
MKYLLIACFVFLLASCKKHRIGKHPEEIIGVWHISFPPPCWGCGKSLNEQYSNEGWWFAVEGCNLCLTDNDCDCICDDPCPGQNAAASEKLPYRIEGEYLIRVRHASTFDSLSFLVSDTFVIQRFQRCTLSKGINMILEPVNQSAADYLQVVIGGTAKGEKAYYNKSFDGCVTAMCNL